ncbi:MAG: Trm112 family protein [Hyphomicrobiaceae bacterium]|nr:Trm112 family protein [Hyphomicrobiaceae bacterium]
MQGEQQTDAVVAYDAQREASARPDRRMLTMLVCPSTRTELIYDAARQELISRAARLAFPIRAGVPVMTPDEARQLDDDELRALAKRCGPSNPAP